MQSPDADAQLHGAIAAFVVTSICHWSYLGTAYRLKLQVWREKKVFWLPTLSILLGIGLACAVVFALSKHGTFSHSHQRNLLLAWKVVIFLPNLIIQLMTMGTKLTYLPFAILSCEGERRGIFVLALIAIIEGLIVGLGCWKLFEGLEFEFVWLAALPFYTYSFLTAAATGPCIRMQTITLRFYSWMGVQASAITATCIIAFKVPSEYQHLSHCLVCLLVVAEHAGWAVYRENEQPPAGWLLSTRDLNTPPASSHQTNTFSPSSHTGSTATTDDKNNDNFNVSKHLHHHESPTSV